MEAQIKVGMDASGVEVSAEKVKKSLSSIQNQIQRTTATLAGGEKGSRQFYEALANQRGVSVASLKPYLDQLDAAKMKAEAAAKATDGMKGAVESLGPKLAAVFSGAAIVGFASKLVSVQREFDVLNSSLITVTGSSANAAREMQWIKDFAKETPFGLAQATQGFVKMKALGLDPTRASLTSFGNTASAMGKDLNQMIEAVADASTGEFERLKEFGIKARKAGDEVSLTFQGITTTIGNSASEITGYLEKLGNVEFAGAMAERAKTLDGAISELADTWDELFRTINTNNAGGLIYDSVKLATGAITDAITIIEAMSGAASENAKQTGAMAAIQGGIATVFETVAVVGANLKFVLVGIGNEIGGLAAQVGQAAQFNFAGVRAIREQMVSDAIAARKEIDATTARILGARDAAKELATYTTRNAGASTDPRRLDAPVTKITPRTTGGGGAAKAIKAEIDEAAKAVALYNDILAKAAGYNANFTESVTALAKAYQLTSMTAEEYRGALDEILGQQPGAVAAAKALKDASAAADKYIDSLNKSADAVEGQLQKLQDEEEALLLSASANITLAEAIAEVEIARLREKQVMEIIGGNDVAAQAIQREIDARRELAQSINSKDAREAAKKGAEKAAEEWQKAADKINDTLTDALMRGFEDGKGFAENMRDTIVNMFKTMVLRPTIQAVLSPIAQSITGALNVPKVPGTGSGLSAFSDLTSFAGAGYQALTGSLAGASSASLLGANAVGAVGGDALGALIAANGQWAGVSTVASAGSVGAAGTAAGAGSGIASSLAAAGPYLAAAAAVIAIAKSFDDSGTYHSGGTGSYSADKGVGYGASAYSFGLGGSEYRQDANVAAGQVAMAVSSIIDTAAGIAGSSAKSFVGTGYADDSSGDGAWGGLLIRLGDQMLTDWGRGGDKWPGREFADGAEGQKQYLDAIALDVRKAIDTIGLPEWATQYIDALGEGAGLEGLAQALEKIKLTEAAFVTLGDVFVGLADLSDGAKNALLTVSGGMEALATTASSYYANFYTGEEKAARLTEKTSEAFAKLGLVMPAINDATRENYRALIDELAAKDLSIEANAKAYAGALSLQGAMDELAPAFDQAATGAKVLAESLASVLGKVADSALDGLSRAVDAERDTITAAYESQSEAIQSSLDAVSTSVGKLQALSDTLKSTLDSMRIGGSESTYRAAAQSQISAALASVRAGGALPVDGQLDSALRTVSQPSEQLFSSFEDYARDFYKTANDIAALGDLTTVQLSAEEATQLILRSQLTALEDGFRKQNRALDDILSNAEEQLDAAKGIDNSVQSVADAVLGLGAILGALGAATKATQTAALGSTIEQYSANYAATVNPAYANATSATSYATSREAEIAGLYSSTLGRAADTGGLSYWASSGLSIADISASIASSAESAARAVSVATQNQFINLVNENLGIQSNLKAFAVGTNYVPSDMTAQIHEGERIIPAADNRELMARLQNPQGNNEVLVAELRALRAEVASLKSATVQTAENTKATAKQLNYWDADGMPATTI